MEQLPYYTIIPGDAAHEQGYAWNIEGSSYFIAHVGG